MFSSTGLFIMSSYQVANWSNGQQVILPRGHFTARPFLFVVILPQIHLPRGHLTVWLHVSHQSSLGHPSSCSSYHVHLSMFMVVLTHGQLFSWSAGHPPPDEVGQPPWHSSQWSFLHVVIVHCGHSFLCIPTPPAVRHSFGFVLFLQPRFIS